MWLQPDTIFWLFKPAFRDGAFSKVSENWVRNDMIVRLGRIGCSWHEGIRDFIGSMLLLTVEGVGRGQ